VIQHKNKDFVFSPNYDGLLTEILVEVDEEESVVVGRIEEIHSGLMVSRKSRNSAINSIIILLLLMRLQVESDWMCDSAC
jgi:hypothetical protein